MRKRTNLNIAKTVSFIYSGINFSLIFFKLYVFKPFTTIKPLSNQCITFQTSYLDSPVIDYVLELVYKFIYNLWAWTKLEGVNRKLDYESHYWIVRSCSYRVLESHSWSCWRLKRVLILTTGRLLHLRCSDTFVYHPVSEYCGFTLRNYIQQMLGMISNSLYTPKVSVKLSIKHFSKCKK